MLPAWGVVSAGIKPAPRSGYVPPTPTSGGGTKARTADQDYGPLIGLQQGLTHA
jgi:hypothetical protein